MIPAWIYARDQESVKWQLVVLKVRDLMQRTAWREQLEGKEKKRELVDEISLVSSPLSPHLTLYSFSKSCPLEQRRSEFRPRKRVGVSSLQHAVRPCSLVTVA